MLRWLVILLLMPVVAPAAEWSRAYRYTDSDGRVVYSQTPPISSNATEIDIRPAQRGRGGVVMPYNPRLPGSTEFTTNPNTQTRAASTASVAAAREQQLAALKAQCVANRGTDCNDPRALQYLQAQQIPRQRYYY